MEKFTKKLNKHLSVPIQVQEFVTTGSSEDDVALRAVASIAKDDPEIQRLINLRKQEILSVP